MLWLITRWSYSPQRLSNLSKLTKVLNSRAGFRFDILSSKLLLLTIFTLAGSLFAPLFQHIPCMPAQSVTSLTLTAAPWLSLSLAYFLSLCFSWFQCPSLVQGSSCQEEEAWPWGLGLREGLARAHLIDGYGTGWIPWVISESRWLGRSQGPRVPCEMMLGGGPWFKIEWDFRGCLWWDAMFV